MQAIIDGLLDEIRRQDRTPLDLVARSRSHFPFTVICELLGVPESDAPRRHALTTLLTPTEPDEYARAKAASDRWSGCSNRLVDGSSRPGDDLVGADQRPRRG